MCEAHSPPHLACRKARVRNAQATRDASRWQPPLMESTHGGLAHTPKVGSSSKHPGPPWKPPRSRALKKKKNQHLFDYFQPAMYVMTRPGEITKSPNPYKTSGTPYPVSQEQPSLPGSTRKTQLGLCFLRSPQRYLSCDRSPNSSYKGRPRKEALNSYKFFKRLHPGAVQGGKVHAETFSFREHRAAFSSRDNCLHLAVTVNTSREVPHQRQSC